MSGLCRDCLHCKPTRHYRPGELGGYAWHTYEDARCVITDVVTGTGSAGRLCVDERAPTSALGKSCGPSADRFEPKPPEPARPAAPKRRWWFL